MTTQIIELVDGKIPAHTKCPFYHDCPSAKNFTCKHRGVDHLVPFSCGYARLFKILEKRS